MASYVNRPQTLHVKTKKHGRSDHRRTKIEDKDAIMDYIQNVVMPI